MSFFIILAYDAMFILSLSFCGELGEVLLYWRCKLSLNLIDLIISGVTHGDFLCLCLLNFACLIWVWDLMELVRVLTRRL